MISKTTSSLASAHLPLILGICRCPSSPDGPISICSSQERLFLKEFLIILLGKIHKGPTKSLKPHGASSVSQKMGSETLCLLPVGLF